jgi:DNA-binding beta-propeller fold protein YncE
MGKIRGGPKSVMAIKINAPSYLEHRHWFMIAFLLLVLIVVPTGPAFSINIVHIRFLYKISADFKEPSDVAVSKRRGYIYVVDGVNHKIKIFKPKGEAISNFGEEGDDNGQFRYPLGIDVDHSGRIYIADSGNRRVQIFGPNAVFSAKIDLPERNGRPADPTDVAVDTPRKRLYVVDNDNHRVLIYDLSTLRLIKTVGKPGEGELMFRHPFLIALNKEQFLHIVDVINTRVQVVSPEGQFVRYIGGWGVEKGHFFRPKGIAIDSRNRVYVSDSYMGVVQVFESWGKFYGVLGDAGKNEVKKFKTPTGMYIDDHNLLYVVEMRAQQVSVYRIETKGK